MISAVVLTKNEEKNIDRCIRSLVFCDEIIVVDDNSTDRTIAKILNSKLKILNTKIKIYERDLNNDFAGQRNFGLRKATGEWILFVDADEVISKELAKEISEAVKNNSSDYTAYRFKRHDFLWGRLLGYGEVGSARLVRLAKKRSGKWVRKVHETWQVEGSIGELKNPILHYPHKTLKKFVDEVNYYSTLHARENYNESKRSSVFKIVFFPVLKFNQNFFLRAGFLDSVPGLVHALVMSFHSYLSWSKLWILQKKS